MKKTLLTLLATICLLNANAQVIEDFENWNPYTIYLTTQMTEPVGWTGSDSFLVGYGKGLNPFGTFQAQVFQENPGQAGTGALRVVSRFQDDIATISAKIYPCIATNSNVTLNLITGGFSQSGGTTINGRAVSTSMHVKTSLYGGDSTFITALLIDNSDGADSVVGFADTIFSSNITTYAQITLPFTYIDPNAIPTIVRYTISSGNPLAFLDSTGFFSVHDSTELVVDNININFPTGVKQVIGKKKIAQVYPTQVQEVFYVNMIGDDKDNELRIFNTNGQLVRSILLKEKINTIDIKSLQSANYIYTISKLGVVHQSGKLLKN